MGKSVLLVLSHSIEEHDQVQLLSRLGYDVFSLGGYIDPHHPHDPKRPPVPEATRHPELQAIVDGLGVPDNIGAAASYIPDGILEWLGDDGIIIAHHYLEGRIYPQWDHIEDWLRGSPERRFIRRTVGQSVAANEQIAREFVARGMETVRYSPKERAIPLYSGEDALIRFWVDPDLYGGWTGDDAVVVNVTQHLFQRDPYTNGTFAELATWDLPRVFAGPGSETHPDGIGEVTFDGMRDLLRASRAYIYTGTQPASYTLGLIEAMMTGTPVVSIGPSHFGIVYTDEQGGNQHTASDLFEGHELANGWSDDPAKAQEMLRVLVNDYEAAERASVAIRTRARELFHPTTVGRQWREFLG